MPVAGRGEFGRGRGQAPDKGFNRELVILGIFALAVVAIFGGLFKLCVIDAAWLKERAEYQAVKTTVDVAKRGTIYDRTFWTLFALCICFSNGIWQYTRYNIDFRRRYGNIAIFIMAISALLPYAETTPIVLYLALGGTALGALLCFALMANYHIARRGPAVMADIVARREPRYLRGPRTRDTLYTYTFAIHDPDFEFEWGEERGTILGPVTTPGLPVRIDRGCLGMRIIRPI